MIRIYESGNPSNYLEIPGLKKPNLPAIVTFYRSALNADDKAYGTKDTQYHGDFGFDRFDKKVIAEGLANNYESLDGVEEKKPVEGNSHKYLCPYLSLYPPNVTGNLDSIKSKVTLYVRLEEDKDKGTDEPDFGSIQFQSSDPNSVEIIGTKEHKLAGKKQQTKLIPLKIGKNEKAKPITIKCNQAFSTPIFIKAMTSKGTEIGQLIVVPNQDIYNLTVQPVYVKLSTTTDSQKTDKPLSSIADIQAKELTEYLNKKSLNQALINCTLAPNVHTFIFNRALISEYMHTQNGKSYLYKDNTKRVSFNSAIEQQYSRILNNSGSSQANEETIKNEVYFSSGTYNTVQKFLTQLDKRFKYNIKASSSFKEAKRAHEDDELTNAYNHKKVKEALADFRASEQKMNAELQKKGIKTGGELKPNFNAGIPKQGTIYVFYYPDIEAAYADVANDLSKGSVPGYTLRENGISHMFKSGFNKADAIVHEICHGLGLEHTFEKELGKAKPKGIKTQEDYEKEITIAEEELKRLRQDEKEYYSAVKTMEKKGYINIEDFSKYDNLNTDYRIIKNSSDLKVTQLNKKSYNTYIYFKQMVAKIEDVIKTEKDPNKINEILGISTPTDITQLKADIVTKETEIQTLKQLKVTAPKDKTLEGESNCISQSDTMENYMDYDFNDSGSRKYFQRKTLTQQQWGIIRNIGKQNGYLKK